MRDPSENHELRVEDRNCEPGIFDGEHRLKIVPLGNDQVRLEQSERFSGLLVPILKKSLDTITRAGFEAMNQAVKRRAEMPTAERYRD